MAQFFFDQTGRFSGQSYYGESQVKNLFFLEAQILETLFFDNSVKPGLILLNLLIE